MPKPDEMIADCAPTVRQSMSHTTAAAAFAGVADVPDATPDFVQYGRFGGAMRDDFSCVRYQRIGSGDIPLQDVCNVAAWAQIQAECLRVGSRDEKRGTPGWRERHRALDALQKAALAAALATRATTPDGVVAKFGAMASLINDPKRLEMPGDALWSSALLDHTAMSRVEMATA